jgi:hypothetical protein
VPRYAVARWLVRPGGAFDQHNEDALYVAALNNELVADDDQ